jgi:hypothetical protein
VSITLGVVIQKPLRQPLPLDCRQPLHQALSKRAAITKYGVGRHTLKKMMAHDEPPGHRQARQWPKPKLESFLPVIRQILGDDGKGAGQRNRSRSRTARGRTAGDAVFQKTRPRAFTPQPHPADRVSARNRHAETVGGAVDVDAGVTAADEGAKVPPSHVACGTGEETTSSMVSSRRSEARSS